MQGRPAWVLFGGLALTILLFLVPLQLFADAAAPTLQVQRVDDGPPGVAVRVLAADDERDLPAPLRAALESAATHGAASVTIDAASARALDRLGAGPGHALVIVLGDASLLARLVPARVGALDAARDVVARIERHVGA